MIKKDLDLWHVLGPENQDMHNTFTIMLVLWPSALESMLRFPVALYRQLMGLHILIFGNMFNYQFVVV